MIERCSCGALIIARRSDVAGWRSSHRHEVDSFMVPPTGGGSLVESAWQPIGFRPDAA